MDHVRGVNSARPEHVEQVVESVLESPARGENRVVIVGIDGPACSGKSSLAQQVAGRLGDCPIVHMDDLYPGWDGLAAAIPRLTDDILIPLRAGEPARYERYDWESGEFTDEIEVPATEFLVVEGCGSTVGAAGQLVDVKVWLEADPEVRHRRGQERDEGGFEDHWDAWAAQEEQAFTVDETRAHADVVIDTTG